MSNFVLLNKNVYSFKWLLAKSTMIGSIGKHGSADGHYNACKEDRKDESDDRCLNELGDLHGRVQNRLSRRSVGHLRGSLHLQKGFIK